MPAFAAPISQVPISAAQTWPVADQATTWPMKYAHDFRKSRNRTVGPFLAAAAMTVGLRLVFADPDDPVYGVFGGGTDQEGCRFHG